jgi:hypothetical protein
MSENEKLIEEAAKAIAAFTNPAEWTAFRGEAEAVLAVFEKEHTPTVTDDMVAEALDAKATMSQLHFYLYSTEKCRCGEEWTDAHWMRFILERALSRAAVEAKEPGWEYGTRRSVTDGWESGDRYGEHEYIDARSISDNINEDRSTTLPRRDMTRAVRRRKAGPWVPLEN